MTIGLERRVRARARDACEYCRLPQAYYPFTFAIDHIIARQHGGPSSFANLALACPRCNLHKGPNIAGVDPITKQIVPHYHPRRNDWRTHFRWRGARLIGLTLGARATIRVLAINHLESVALRRTLIAEGTFPPTPEAGL